MSAQGTVIVALYLLAVVAANLSAAAFGPAATVVNAFLLIGFDLTSRDYLQQRWEGANLWPRMALLIGVGGALSYIVNANAAPIAIASTVSFVASGALDAVVFALIGKRVGRMLRWNGTNLVGAGIDSLVFPTLAFGSILPAIVIGQYAAKVGGGFLWSLVILHFPRRRRCAKCGNGGAPGIRYHRPTGSPIPGCVWYCPSDGVTGHLMATCRRCGFKWLEPVRDAVPLRRQAS